METLLGHGTWNGVFNTIDHASNNNNIKMKVLDCTLDSPAMVPRGQEFRKMDTLLGHGQKPGVVFPILFTMHQITITLKRKPPSPISVAYPGFWRRGWDIEFPT